MPQGRVAYAGDTPAVGHGAGDAQKVGRGAGGTRRRASVAWRPQGCYYVFEQRNYALATQALL